MRHTRSENSTDSRRAGSRRRRPLWAAAAVAGVPVVAGGALLGAAVWRADGDVKSVAKTAYRALKSAVRGDGTAAAAVLSAALAPPVLPERADEPMVAYRDGLAKGWQDWSWAKRDLNAGPGRGGGGKAVRMTQEGWKGLYLHREATSTDGYGILRLFVKGQNGKLTLSAADRGGKLGKQVPLEPSSKFASRAGDGWTEYRVPLTALGIKRAGGGFSGFAVQDGTGRTNGEVYIDDIALLPDPSLAPAPTAATVAVSVDLSAKGSPISPYIYGMSFATPEILADLRLPINRWGGNDKSRYNWRHGNAVNAARDWRWANRVASGNVPADAGPSSAADRFVAANRTAGAESLLTVPTLGWVAKDTNNGNTSVGVPKDGGPPLRDSDGPIRGYDPAANRAKTSLRSVAREKNAQPGEVAQDAWVRHLVGKFGGAEGGGVRFYAMDNEPDLWQHTHTDVRPARVGYDDILSSFLTYATAVKDVDPAARVTGPVSWGWTGYLYSPLDQGSDNYKTYADRKKHGDEPFLLWFLKQVRAHDARTGSRTLDVLDIHYYPQAGGVYGSNADTKMRELRLRTVRSLWDPKYVDESWIGEPVRLLPRMREWIAQGYPGTRLGITEWNFGADKDISGGLATADALGIYGREGVYMAQYWAYPRVGSPAYLAFKLYRNADGRGAGFGDLSLPVKVADDSRLSCYAARDAKSGALTLLFVNKMRKATITAPVTLSGGNALAGPARLFSFSVLAPGALVSATGPEVQGGRVTLTLPPYSATLARFAAEGGAK